MKGNHETAPEYDRSTKRNRRGEFLKPFKPAYDAKKQVGSAPAIPTMPQYHTKDPQLRHIPMANPHCRPPI